MNTPQELHQRYQIQATWTASVRRHLLERADLDKATRVLEVGCGTGVITSELTTLTRARAYGLDIDRHVLSFAHANQAPGQYLAGDALALPYAEHTFDVSLCHFLLLWVTDVDRVLAEMVRVTVPGGRVLALAEPDYGGRVDYPESLAEVGKLQARSLEAQGSDPQIGRKLRALFARAGLIEVLAGVLGGEWDASPEPDAMASEWDTLLNDLQGMLSPEELEAFRRQDQMAWSEGSRVLFVPTFYAMGRVPLNGS
jgi:SAM-dependent methyltransferase